jgi:hypothetical protein
MTDREFMAKIAANAHATHKRLYLNARPYLVIWSLNESQRGDQPFAAPLDKLKAGWLDATRRRTAHATLERKPPVRGLPPVLPLLANGVRPRPPKGQALQPRNRREKTR